MGPSGQDTLRSHGGRAPQVQRLGSVARARGARVRARAAVYCRVSSHHQKKQGDLDRQVEAALSHCKGRGYVVVGEYRDVGSGLNARRKGLARLCREIQADEVRVWLPCKLFQEPRHEPRSAEGEANKINAARTRGRK
ncbi:MAG: recombinase family protein [Candidatus Helarchaeota archaeon]